MSEPLKDKPQKAEKKIKIHPEGSRAKEKTGRIKDPASTHVMHVDEHVTHHEDAAATTSPNTYQLGPYKLFPITTISYILKEEITHCLRDMQYEPLHSREMTLTLCEVIRTRVKELMIPRYKTVILVHIGQLNGQGMQISSRCLWDPNFDTFVSHSFKNTSLFCSATVYGIYFE
ncbi:PREDICTED: tctex1 domain-containing protein 1-A-like [Poecilia mexicana]|uniref:Tctex1 domain containing 1 n=1 Tax=Poecilia mexicana TaxID=48701 RepID=A0A3B3YMG8_9TELE|nr:PREDICTED: tctex1 domain-containing protein 1-A [Poecilia formosa]XP_014851043.1 PREDICTED: tctex1 domain-containing protein 1-A-like [Poecilia mexicana]XP_014851044.1 PREDICTED: tctex1 domain-containing protein 1-A-like [Poecilia mexicana]XP_016528359.1 PREDICTED: tctex1 domain-containing protein 1-A [Poecilia formosa]